MQFDTGIMVPASIDHFGIVVRDVDKNVEYFSSTLGTGPWRIFKTIEYYKKQVSLNELGVGEPFDLKLAFARLGAATIELIQPLNGESVYSQFLEEKGEGVHHLAYSVSDFDGAVTKLLRSGSKIIAGGFSQGKRWALLDMISGGVIIEPLDNFTAREQCGL